ncbi:MAG: hypothetical protein CVV56_08060 [Tenericutes bacterium HGW-Tenericutes-1]|jgi:ATP-dependent protease ClpP protease subunit|nr:MAG: hypothetical protein CVV56_08060 [Tenericutes bacterium HGW-Tenericutes-1]PKM95799.1 MAG: hypothetical protein CVU84_03090 [Firmicutes bacterium HGW-Firmicutes-1]
MPNAFWEFKNKSESTAELMLYGEIASQESWWDELITPKKFAKDLKNLGSKDNIIVRINSGGGSVSAATAIYTQLRDNNAKITVIIDGIAASAATIIAMAGDEIKIPRNGMMMIHDPSYTLWGNYNAESFRKLADTLDTVKEAILSTYESRTGMTRDELSELMSDETWLTGEEAVEMGFADSLLFEEATNVMNGNMLCVNNVSHDISHFKTLVARLEKNKFISESSNTSTQNLTETIKNNQNEGGLQDVEIKTVEDLKNAYPDLVNQVIDTTREESSKNERDRLKAIDEIANTLDPTLVVNAKYGDTVMSAQELAFEAIKNDAQKGINHLKEVADDATNSNVTGVGVKPNTQEEEAKATASQETVNAMVAGANNRREN